MNQIPSLSELQIAKKDETRLLVKQFNGLDIQIYGTYEYPLFKAKDVGDLLGIEKIRKTIEYGC